MTPKIKGLWTLGITFALTILVTIFKEFPPGYAKGGWLIWAGFSWNFFAYAFDRGMWPRAFVELDGFGKGKEGVRGFHFWLTVVIYLSFLALMDFSEK